MKSLFRTPIELPPHEAGNAHLADGKGMPLFITDQQEASPRNSRLRELGSAPINAIINLLADVDSITPNRITAVSTLGVLATSLMVIRRPELAEKLLAPYIIFSVMDALDGNLARERQRRGEGELNDFGGLLDTGCDKVQEWAIFTALAMKAKNDGKSMAKWANLIAAATVTLPALERSNAEQNGFIVKEGGLGTRAFRAIQAGAGLKFGDKPGVLLAVGLSVAANNILTAMGRRKVARFGSSAKLFAGYKDSDDAPEFTKKKSFLLILLTGLAISGTSYLSAKEMLEKHRAS